MKSKPRVKQNLWKKTKNGYKVQSSWEKNQCSNDMFKINHPLPKQTKSSALIKSYKIAGDVLNDMRDVWFYYISCALHLMLLFLLLLLGLYCIVSFVFTFDCLLSIDDITRILLIQLLPLIMKWRFDHNFRPTLK